MNFRFCFCSILLLSLCLILLKLNVLWLQAKVDFPFLLHLTFLIITFSFFLLSSLFFCCLAFYSEFWLRFYGSPQTQEVHRWKNKQTHFDFWNNTMSPSWPGWPLTLYIMPILSTGNSSLSGSIHTYNLIFKYDSSKIICKDTLTDGSPI